MSKDLVREQFGANAAAYVTSAVHARGNSLTRLVELAPPQPHWQVLDIATAAGHTQDPRADSILQQAWQLVTTSAARIRDPRLRQSYLTQVPVHRAKRHRRHDYTQLVRALHGADAPAVM